MSVPDGYKRCPDCAELVRAQARKCRFCGYRFDDAPERARDPGGKPSSLTELLSEWGTALASDEEIAFFLPARVREIDRKSSDRDVEGFLLITDRRLVVYRPLARGVLGFLRRERGNVEIAFSMSLGDVTRVSVERRWRRAELRLGDELLLGGVPSKKIEEIRRHLSVRG